MPNVDVYSPHDAIMEMQNPRSYAFKLIPSELWNAAQLPKPLPGWDCVRWADGSYTYVHRGLERAAMARSGLL